MYQIAGFLLQIKKQPFEIIVWVSCVENRLISESISIFILVINQLDAQNLFYNKFISCLYMFRAPCAHRQEVKIVLYSFWYHHTCRWPSRARGGHLQVWWDARSTEHQKKYQYSRCTSQNTEHSHKENMRGAVHLNIGTVPIGSVTVRILLFSSVTP